MTHHTGIRKCLVTNGQMQHRADSIGVLRILLKLVNCGQRCLCTAETHNHQLHSSYQFLFVMQRRWETAYSSSLGSCGRARTKPSFPIHSSLPSGIEKFRRDFLNGVASQPSCLLDTSPMNLSSPGTDLFYFLWPLQHPVAVSHNLITPCVNRFNAALESAISTCKETFSV